MPNKHKNFPPTSHLKRKVWRAGIKRTFVLLPLFVVSIFSFVLIYSVFAGDITPAKVIELTNRARAGKGFGALAENAKLSQAADDKARDMIKNDYFAHTSPSGKDPWYWMKKEGYEYKAAGENLAINFTDAKEQQSAWMDSKTHRANILNANYKEIGVAVVEGKIDGQSSIVTVQMFGTPLYAAADQVKTIVPPMLQEEKASEIKGTETVVEEINIPNMQNVPEVVPVLPTEQISAENIVTMSWSDVSIFVAVAILALVAFTAPMVFIAVAYELLIVGIRMKNIETEEVVNNNYENSIGGEYHLKV